MTHSEVQGIRLAIHGASGRTGRRAAALAAADARFESVLEADRSLDPSVPRPTPNLIVDFTSDAGARRAVELARKWSAALLVATTGLTDETLSAIDALATELPVMLAPNTSRGVAILNRLALLAAELVGPGFDVDLIEAHHRHKQDAPSGTAVRLRELLRETSGGPLGTDATHAVRAGGLIGEHSLLFTGGHEQLIVTHRALDRDLFASGALDAACWLAERPAGFYRVDEAWGLAPTPAGGSHDPDGA
mgnify:CR=1 FL=1